MASNSFGQHFKVTTWGESHGKAIGAVIDGCPAGLSLSEAEINKALAIRAPGNSPFTSPRKEPDKAQLYSGVFEGKTTGTPISIIINNQDADSRQYTPVKHLMKPGHANFTYLKKYGIFDYRGGGRASARETATRVAAGSIAEKILNLNGINLISFIKQIGDVCIDNNDWPNRQPEALNQLIYKSPIFCPDSHATNRMMNTLNATITDGDSLGGIVQCYAINLPTGLGEPVFDKLEANLAKAMLSIPASKGIEIGEGFRAASMQGFGHNDAFNADGTTKTNHAGGTLGGISTGMPLSFSIAFKPTSSIKKPQQTIDTQNNLATFNLPANARHDPCVAIRAVPVVKAMCALVLVDSLLANRLVKLEY